MIGKLLFITQVITLILCFLPLRFIIPTPVTLLFFSAASALGLWVLLHNRLGNWSVLPAPKLNAKIITSGPYQFMRHPMYTSMILGTLAGVFHNQSIQAFVAWLSLIIILNLKARYEERLLLIRFSDYQAYLNTVKTRFFPSLF